MIAGHCSSYKRKHTLSEAGMISAPGSWSCWTNYRKCHV